MKARYLTGALAVLAVTCTAPAASRAQSNTPALHVRAFAVNMSNIGTGSTATVEMNIERYMSFWERRNQPRTVDYPFTLIEMRLDAKGEGSGRMAVATKISFNKGTNVIELEHFASEPVRLTKIEIT